MNRRQNLRENPDPESDASYSTPRATRGNGGFYRDRRETLDLNLNSNLRGGRGNYDWNNNPQRGRGRGRGGDGGRGGNFQRGGFRGSWQGYRPRKREPEGPPSWIDSRGELLTSVSLSEPPETVPRMEIQDVELLGSYNWVGHGPKIVVPGSPPLWRPTSDRGRLQEDCGIFYRDINAAHYSKHLFEPTIRSVLAITPSFNPESFDIIACGSTIGNLLRFASGLGRSFRFDVELIGNTVFFIRKEGSPKETIDGVRGFGHRFVEVNTEWERDMTGSVSHQRVISYRFGGKKILVRFESDGYLEDKLPVYTELDSRNVNEESKSQKVDDLLLSFSAVRISNIPSNSHATTSNSDSESDDFLSITLGGKLIPQPAVFDIKTRSIHRQIDMEEVHRRLWISQTPKFIGAYHTDGVFKPEDIHVKDIRSDIAEWQDSNQGKLWQLSSLIDRIVEMARTSRIKSFEVSRVAAESLEIRKRMDREDGKRALPDDLLQLWVRSESRSGEDHDNDEAWERDTIDFDDSASNGFASDYSESDDDDEEDYTACSASDCGYCGRCKY